MSQNPAARWLQLIDFIIERFGKVIFDPENVNKYGKRIDERIGTGRQIAGKKIERAAFWAEMLVKNVRGLAKNLLLEARGIAIKQE